VRLVTATVVRLERTLAHESDLSGIGSVKPLSEPASARPLGFCPQQVGPDCCPGRVPQTVFRHAAPVDTGSTEQRYAVADRRVKPRPVKPGYTKTTRTPVDNRLIHRSTGG
jgi:hypothetical protein